MKICLKPCLGFSLLALPLFAGALMLEVGDPALNPEALRNHAVLVARTTACHAPAETTVVATAEGIVDGTRKSIPMKVISLSAAGSFAVLREWPDQGTWAIKVTATNPEYKNYATGLVVPIHNNVVQLPAAKHYFHAPTDSDVLLALN